MVDGVGAFYLVAGLAAIAAALVPRFISRLPLSMPMVFLGAGFVLFTLIPDIPDPDPLAHPVFVEHLTEICVVISLMGAGLALNRPVGWRRWSTTWRLLTITMPLSMLAVGVLGWFALGFGAAASVLVAAVLAPTDPVLAGEVQVGEPATDDDDHHEDEARFALTSEAGLNDGLAFPFAYAAISMSLVGAAPQAWLGHWLAVDVGWRLGMGLVVGLGVGWVLRKLFFASRAERLNLAEQAEGFVALAATFVAYGVAELLQGYGFIAVFTCACTIRAAERSHDYHRVLHSYVEQLERLLTVSVLLLLGGSVAGGILADVGMAEVAVAAAFLLLIRPLSGLVGLVGRGLGPRERLVVAFFGVRGVGSLYYIAYALERGDFAEPDRLWAIVVLVVVGSVLLHGVSATPAMALLDRRRRQAAVDGDTAPAATAV